MRGPLSLVSKIEELLRRNSSDTLCPQTLALTTPTSGGHSVGIVRSRIEATEFSFFSLPYMIVSVHNACYVSLCFCTDPIIVLMTVC
jgi:hypothetical protein